MKLLAEARMLFKPALGANRRADFESCKISDDGDAAEIVMLASNEYNGDRVAVVVVREQDLIEDALERLGRMLSLSHANRITRGARRVQLASIEASTEHPRQGLVTQCSATKFSASAHVVGE